MQTKMQHKCSSIGMVEVKTVMVQLSPGPHLQAQFHGGLKLITDPGSTWTASQLGLNLSQVKKKQIVGGAKCEGTRFNPHHHIKQTN